MIAVPATEQLSMLENVRGADFSVPTGSYSTPGGNAIVTPAVMPAGIKVGMHFWSEDSSTVRKITVVTLTTFTVDGANLPLNAAGFGVVFSDGGALKNCEFRLFSDNITPDRNTAIGDLTECNFGGYAAVPATFAGGFIDGETNVPQTWSNSAQFQSDGTAPEDTARVWGLVQTAPVEKLVCAGKLDTPKVFSTVADALVLVVPYSMDNSVEEVVEQ